jgi:hypothetical protein
MQNGVTKLNLNKRLIKIVFDSSLDQGHSQNFVNVRTTINSDLQHLLYQVLHLRRVA